MSKKWYDLFVVTGDTATGEEAINVAPAPGSGATGTPPVDAAPVQRVSDLASVAKAEVKFTAPVEPVVSMEEIYASAQITTPAHGYSILKVADMLQNEHIRALTGDVKRKSILVALDAAGVKIREIIEDAVRRDQALDTFESVLQKRLDDLRAAKDAENRRIEEEIQHKLAELRARVQENSRSLTQEQDSLKAWRIKKQAEENRIAEAVGYFVAENPITAMSEPGGAKPGVAANPAPRKA